MHRHTKKFLLKIFTLSTFIVILFNIWDNLLNASISTTKNTQNKLIFRKANNNWLGKTWVAIATNIGTNHQEGGKLEDSIYKEILSIEEAIWNNASQTEEIIWDNMTLIKEYLSILKTDPKVIIDSSYDKSATLNAYVDQLEFRYKNWVLNQKNLIKQRDIFIASMTNSASEIENLKSKIWTDFTNSNINGSLENIDSYLELKQKFNFAKIYVTYINQFLNQYSFLNTYSRDLASVLIANKDAIIRDAYVVIPKAWWLEALKKFDLIYEQ